MSSTPANLAVLPPLILLSLTYHLNLSPLSSYSANRKMPAATTTTPLLTASPPHLRPYHIPPIFPDLESQAAYFRARAAEEATLASRFRKWFLKNAVLVVSTVAVGAFVVVLAVVYGGWFCLFLRSYSLREAGS